MGFDVLSRVVAYGVIPTIFAFAGIYLAAESAPKPRQQRIMATFIIVAFAGIGAIWWVETRADHVHAKEITESRQKNVGLQSTLDATRIDDATQLGVLQSDLDTMIKAQPEFAKKIAEEVSATTSALIKKQADKAAAASDAELRSKASDLATDLMVFAKEIQGRLGWTADSNLMSADSTLTADSGAPLTTQGGQVITTQSGQPIAVKRQTDAKSQVLATAREDFNAKYRANAVELRSQLISRLGGVPPELANNFPPYRLIAFEGSMTGPESITYAAEYLKALAKELP